MKAVIIGAGSAFGGRLSVDILSRPPLQDSSIALCDIDTEKLELTTGYVHRVIDSNGLPAKLETSTDRNELLPGMVVRAIAERSRESAFQALLFDPATQAVLSPRRMRQMFDEMWEAEGDLLSAYS